MFKQRTVRGSVRYANDKRLESNSLMSVTSGLISGFLYQYGHMHIRLRILHIRMHIRRARTYAVHSLVPRRFLVQKIL